MAPIIRGTGTTDSERYLAALADKTFLDLWSYPNTYIDKKLRGQGDGKELCDLLVVFGNDIIIFSDKSVGWPEHEDVAVSWRRWFKKAIEKSVDQIRGAERWLQKFPDRVFVDKICTQRIPVEFSPVESRTVHGIAVVQGAEDFSRRHFGDEIGSLAIFSDLKGDDHVRKSDEGVDPFKIGDVDPTGTFVHVFDMATLNLLMGELDTASDFVRYLKLRAKAVRERRIVYARDERELLAFYLQNENSIGEHSFDPEGGDPDAAYALPDGGYRRLVSRPEYRAKIEANKISYTWDRLISLFSEHVLAGTSVAVRDLVPEPTLAEPALRIMAGEDRTMRRALATTFVDALQKAESLAQHRYARVVTSDSAMGSNAYIFLVLAYPKNVKLRGGYEQYRRARIGILETYCYAALYDNRNLKKAVGIAMDAPSSVSGRKGGSEDLIAVEVSNWTDELIREVKERREAHEIMVEGRMTYGALHTQEYPEIIVGADQVSRQQRRAAERARRKEAKKFARNIARRPRP